MIEVTGLSKHFGSFVAIRDINFSIAPQEIVGLLGPNGAGKTTILKILSGFHFPSSGEVCINGLRQGTDDLAIKQLIGYLPENAPLYPELLVQEFLDFIAATRLAKYSGYSKSHTREAIEQVLESCGLKNVRHKSIQNLSKGYRQRVGIAQAILHNPQIIILDEPTNGLDPNQILEIRHLIIELGKSKTILLSTHTLQEVEAICQRVLILNQGVIAAQGTTKEISNRLGRSWRCQIVVKGAIDDFLQQISSQHGVSLKLINGSENQFELTCPYSSMDKLSVFQEYIFDTALSTNCKILENSPIYSTLEDVFASLTQNGAAPYV